MTNTEKVQRELESIGKNSRLLATSTGDEIPSRLEIKAIVLDTLSAMFPNYFSPEKDASLELIEARLSRQINMACRFAETEMPLSAREAARHFIESLPNVKRLLLTDVEALYEGDPAAKFRDEVIICYPGFFATAVYRMAHILYEIKVPIVPRMMTEYAHEHTGVDIHAGAKIGEYFFIDHATGIVIGETTVIGDHVKLYQGVYANATILGGQTTIGDNSIIGASTWIIDSVPEGSRIFYSADTAKAMELWGDMGSGI